MSSSPTTARAAAAVGSAASRRSPGCARLEARARSRRPAAATDLAAHPDSRTRCRRDRGPLDIADAAGAALGRAIAGLIGALDVQRIVLLGPRDRSSATPWLAAVRREARRAGALALLADDVRDRCRPADDERRGPRCLGPARRPRARPEPRPMTATTPTVHRPAAAAASAGLPASPSGRRRHRRQQDRGPRRRRRPGDVLARRHVPAASSAARRGDRRDIAAGRFGTPSPRPAPTPGGRRGRRARRPGPGRQRHRRRHVRGQSRLAAPAARAPARGGARRPVRRRERRPGGGRRASTRAGPPATTDDLVFLGIGTGISAGVDPRRSAPSRRTRPGRRDRARRPRPRRRRRAPAACAAASRRSRPGPASPGRARGRRAGTADGRDDAP